MTDNLNQPDDAAAPDDVQADTSASKQYKLNVATNVVPMQRDHLGRAYWESYQTPDSYKVHAECRIPPHLPGVIIFVHGVNSEGEWYDFAEPALCDGLNERLKRTGTAKLVANSYTDIEKRTGKQGTRRIVTPGQSPVIRFYWGYSAVPGTESKWRIPLRNPHQGNYWTPECTTETGPWFWGGGPFQNGTNNLPQLWSKSGLQRHVSGFDLENLNTEADRQLQDAPPREYYSHAAQRLADLIDLIRTECPRDTVTVMSHSQGTMVAIAATALCKKRAPDALFVMNSPFALDDKMTDAVMGLERPTPEARVNTFRNIAHRIRQDKRVFTEADLKQLQCGASEDMDFWRPDNKRSSGVHERDNHGRFYVYFTPHDRVMGASPLQSIGWQGIDDKLLAELGETVKQRMLARVTPVGDDPGVKKFGTLPPIQKPVPGVDPGSFWNGNRGVAGGAFGLSLLWATPPRNKTVTINAEKVPHPLSAEDMRTFEDSRVDAPAMGQWDKDPKDPNKGKYHDDSYRYFRPLYQPETVLVANPSSPIGVSAVRQTPDEKLRQIDAYHAEPTNHSRLPSHPEFMRRVAAYDLPVGFCDAYEKRELWARLIKLADWTQGYDPYFNSGTFKAVPKPAVIDWTTAGVELTRRGVEVLSQQPNNPDKGWQRGLVYGD